MPRSPKRHGLILSGNSWSSLELPVLSASPASWNENVNTIVPSTPRQSILLPGFHFSTTDENVDPAEFHRIAAQLLSGEAPSKRDSGLADDNARPDLQRQLHCDLGKDPSGRYCCSCGKSYTTSLRLRTHVRQCAGTTNFPCNVCEKIFESKDKLDRHVAARHNGNKETCPECGETFLASQLPKHLASGLGGCDGMFQSVNAPAPEIDEAYRESWRKSASQHYWIYEGDLSWHPEKRNARDSMLDDDEQVQTSVVEQTMSFMTQLLRRPTSQFAKKSCDICGETFDADGDELAEHIGRHSLDFAEKRHKCDDCQIFFANEKDLQLHLQSASLNQHCGFTFRHASTCSGHHPPTYYKSSLVNDHDLMQRHLWAWELDQLRTHRLTVASLLAERLNQSMSSAPSLQNARMTYHSLLPHFSVATGDSIRPVSSWSESQPDLECTTELDARLSGIISEITPPEPEPEHNNTAAESDRPDSAIITPEKRLGELRARRKTILSALNRGHKRAQSGPVAFLKQQARNEAEKHRSLPAQPPASGLVAVA